MSQFTNPAPISQNLAEQIFLSSNVEAICNALVSITYFEKDWRWVQEKCILFLNSNNSQIAGLAATCIGHLARIHRQIDKGKVMPVLNENLKRSDIKARIEDAINDITQFT